MMTQNEATYFKTQQTWRENDQCLVCVLRYRSKFTQCEDESDIYPPKSPADESQKAAAADPSTGF